MMRRPSRHAIMVAVLLLLLVVGVMVLGARRQALRDRLMRVDPEAILDQPELASAALAIGQRAFADHCASCHGQGRADRLRGVPDLSDGDFLYGSGQVAEIEQIILHGIRSGDPRGWNLASMPAYAKPRPYAAEPIPAMVPGDVQDMVQYILARHGNKGDEAAAARGARLYAGRGACYDCHGPDGGGDETIGAPNLLDDVWLYGDGSARAIARSLTSGRAGVSPAYAHVLTPIEARATAVYVASLHRYAH